MRVLRKLLSTVFLAILLTVSFSLLITHEVRADTNYPTTSWNISLDGKFVVAEENGTKKWMAQKTGKWLNEHGAPNANSEDYYIVWVQEDKGASSNICWATQSIWVSEHAVNNNDTYDSAANNIGQFDMANPNNNESYCDKHNGKIGGVHLTSEIDSGDYYTYTMFYINQTEIEENARYAKIIDGNKFGQKFTVFLNPIIYTHQGATLRKRDISNLAAWKVAEGWADPSTFWTHYNLMVCFEVSKVEIKQARRARTQSDVNGYKGYNWSTATKIEEDVSEMYDANHYYSLNPDTNPLFADGQAHIRHASVATGASKNASWICTGFYYLGYDIMNGNAEVELEHCYLGQPELKSGKLTDKFGVYYDKRLDKNGNEKNVNAGMASVASISSVSSTSSSSSSSTSRKQKTMEAFSAWMNTGEYCYFRTDVENVKHYVLVWQYSKVTESPITVENYYLKTDYSDIPSDTTIDVGNDWTADSSNLIDSQGYEVDKGDPWNAVEMNDGDGAISMLKTWKDTSGTTKSAYLCG